MKFEDIKKLHQKKYRDACGHFLVEGEHLVLELQKAAARNPALRGCQLYVTSAYSQWQSRFETHVISTRQMAQIADTRTPQGIVALVPVWPASPPREHERAIYLYEIQDPGNLGTILRTLAWFADFRCLLSPDSVDPYNSKAVRASMGAIFHVPLELDVEWPSLRERFARIACLDTQGENLPRPQFKSFDCYVFGNEARGLPREALTALNARPFTIAGQGTLESLNLASAVSICAYELAR
ncbi:MAG TPA: RNA methyltransferase [Steroidobacteraceae bacterium]